MVAKTLYLLRLSEKKVLNIANIIAKCENNQIFFICHWCLFHMDFGTMHFFGSTYFKYIMCSENDYSMNKDRHRKFIQIKHFIEKKELSQCVM